MKKIKTLEQQNKELQFKLTFFEDRNKELMQEIKEVKVPKNTDSDKLKADKKRLLKKCKTHETVIKAQNKEIEDLKKKLESKNKKLKTYEIDIENFKHKISKFTADIEEFRRTNAVLSEAQQKDIDIENRQQQAKIIKLQNYIKELHKNINKCQKIDIQPDITKESCHRSDNR